MPGWHKREEPTTNVASLERKSNRQVKKDIRIDESKTYEPTRDFLKRQRREGEEG